MSKYPKHLYGSERPIQQERKASTEWIDRRDGRTTDRRDGRGAPLSNTILIIPLHHLLIYLSSALSRAEGKDQPMAAADACRLAKGLFIFSQKGNTRQGGRRKGSCFVQQQPCRPIIPLSFSVTPSTRPSPPMNNCSQLACRNVTVAAAAETEIVTDAGQHRLMKVSKKRTSYLLPNWSQLPG